MTAPTWTLLGSVGGQGFGALDLTGRLVRRVGGSVHWSVGADDRWHVPGDDPTLRQRILAPGVVETRVKVPSGDAVERVYGVGGPGDLAVLEFENDSPLPFAVALAIDGDVPVHFVREATPHPQPPIAADRVLMVPVAHRTVTRVAVALAGPGPAAVDVAVLPTSADAERAWRRHLDAGTQVLVPDDRFSRALDVARAGIMLFDDGVEVNPAPFSGAPAADAVAVLTALECWGFGQHAAEVGASVARRHRRKRPVHLGAPAAWNRIGEMLVEASETLTWARDGEGHHGARTAEFLLAARDLIISESGDSVAVFPLLLPRWEGAPLEVHRAPVGSGSLVSCALRWHGDRPALLWEVEGAPVTLTAPGLDPSWSTDDPRGEALLATDPAGARSVRR